MLHDAVDAVADADWAAFERLAIRAIGQSTRWLIIENLILEGSLDRLMHDHPQYSLNRAIVAENRAVIRVIEFYSAVATGEEADPVVYAATVEGFLNEAAGAVDRGRRHAAAINPRIRGSAGHLRLPPAMVERGDRLDRNLPHLLRNRGAESSTPFGRASGRPRRLCPWRPNRPTCWRNCAIWSSGSTPWRCSGSTSRHCAIASWITTLDDTAEAAE